MVTGKDSNPLNEVELLSDSDESVLKLQVGDPIKLTGSDFEHPGAEAR